jgi:uncharacterized membrane protein (DUF2068 family)
MASQSQTKASVRKKARFGVRGVAALEFLKGLVVLLVGAGFATLLHREHDVDDVAASLLYVLHLNHHHHLSSIFLRAADRIQDTNLMLVAIATGVYCIMRFVESYGLWHGRAWAEWFALISGAVYLPLEIYELARHTTPIRWGVFLINVLIVAYMGWLRWRAHTSGMTDSIAA